MFFARLPPPPVPDALHRPGTTSPRRSRSSSTSTRCWRSRPRSPRESSSPRSPWPRSPWSLTLVAGRFVCGWVCPLGSVHQFFSFVFKKARLLKPRPEDESRGRLAWKYYVLIAVLVASVFAVDLVGIADPLSFLYRSFADGRRPLVRQGRRGVHRPCLRHRAGLGGRRPGPVLRHPVAQPTFYQGFFLSLLFIGAVLLNISKERFWCRYLCPAGALLGLLSRWNIGQGADRHGEVHQVQPLHAPVPDPGQSLPERGVAELRVRLLLYVRRRSVRRRRSTFPVKATPEKIDSVNLSRRKLILTTGAGLVAAPFFKITPAGTARRRQAHPPAGSGARAQVPPEPLREVRRMHEGLPDERPAAGARRGRPRGALDARPRAADRATANTTARSAPRSAPTGAIKELTIEEKVKVKIGTAWVNKNRCIPYVLGRPCIVCEEHCPTSPKAIKLVKIETKLPDGTVLTHPERAGHRPRPLHRLRHLREQVPGHGRPGDLLHERRRGPLREEPAAPRGDQVRRGADVRRPRATDRSRGPRARGARSSPSPHPPAPESPRAS